MRELKEVLTPIAAMWLGLVVFAAAPAIADGTISGSGTVNAINAAEHKINITHGPIPELKWPGMTMDFALAKAVSVEKIMVGAVVDFELRREADGSFLIESLKPIKVPGHMPDHSHGD